jgi:hypothetical protein
MAGMHCEIADALCDATNLPILDEPDAGWLTWRSWSNALGAANAAIAAILQAVGIGWPEDRSPLRPKAETFDRCESDQSA